ncbi:hypothetical protein B0H13DRAFT_2307825 [Mycena leptocephala]|nr:hypothetical protein B0H13DRAFT_2307825 [Mycena leptocephala]
MTDRSRSGPVETTAVPVDRTAYSPRKFTCAESTASFSPSCYSQLNTPNSQGFSCRISLTPGEIDALQRRWEEHTAAFHAFVNDAELPTHNSTSQTLQLAPAYFSLDSTPKTSSIVRSSTPDTPLHVHPLRSSPLSKPPPPPHFAVDVDGPTALDAPIHLYPLRRVQASSSSLHNSHVGSQNQQRKIRPIRPHPPTYAHPLPISSAVPRNTFCDRRVEAAPEAVCLPSPDSCLSLQDIRLAVYRADEEIDVNCRERFGLL